MQQPSWARETNGDAPHRTVEERAAILVDLLQLVDAVVAERSESEGALHPGWDAPSFPELCRGRPTNAS